MTKSNDNDNIRLQMSISCQKHMCEDCPHYNDCSDDWKMKSIFYKARLYTILKRMVDNQAFDVGFCPEYDYISDIVSDNALLEAMTSDTCQGGKRSEP